MKQTGLLVNSLDLFGQQMNMQIFGKEKRKTIFGAIVGVISLAFMGIVSIYFLVGFFQKTTKTIIQNKDASIYPYNNLTEFPIIIGVRNPLAVDIPNDGTIFNVHAYKRIDNFTNGIFYGANFIPLPTYNCTQAHFGKFNIEDTPVAKNQICIKPSDQNNLKSYAIEPISGFTGLYFIISRCNPLTNPKCKSKEIIDASLENGVIAFTTYTSNIDNNNVTSPNQYTTSSSTLPLSNTLYKRKNIYLTQNLYQDDTGFIFDSFTTYDFFTMGDTSTDFSLSYPPSYLAFTNGEIPLGHLIVYNSPFIQRTYRSYVKAQTVLANIGGIIKLIMTVATFVTNFVTRKLIFTEIGDYLFEYENASGSFVKLKNVSRSENKIVRESKPIEILRVADLNNRDKDRHEKLPKISVSPRNVDNQIINHKHK